MSTQVQFRRGNTSQVNAFTGALGEVVVDTTVNTCVVQDGTTAGGFPLLKQDGSNSAFSLGTASNCSFKFINDSNTGLISPGSDQIALVTGGIARLTIDSSGVVTIPGNVSISGDLSVSGTTDTSEDIALIVALS